MFFQKISLYEAMTFYNSVEIKEGHYLPQTVQWLLIVQLLDKLFVIENDFKIKFICKFTSIDFYCWHKGDINVAEEYHVSLKTLFMGHEQDWHKH